MPTVTGNPTRIATDGTTVTFEIEAGGERQTFTMPVDARLRILEAALLGRNPVEVDSAAGVATLVTLVLS